MAKRGSISVSWHEASKQFVKWVGFTRGIDGKRRPKCHYLGDNKTGAVARATALLAEWKALVTNGQDAWRAPTAAAATVPADASAASVDRPSTARPQPPRPSMTVEQACQAYLAVIRAERDAKQVTPQHYESMRYKLARIVSYLGPNKTLSSIGEREIKAFVLLLAQRPLVRDKTTPERPMSLGYAKRIALDCKWFLNWLYESELWDSCPRTFARLFRFKAVLTIEERAAQLEQVDS